MTTYHLQADLTFECTDPAQDTDDNFDEFTDAVYDELLNLAELDLGIVDPDMTVTITQRQAHFVMAVQADSQDDATRLFSSNLRCALHAVGCITANWPVFKPTTQTPEVRKAEVGV